MEIYNTGAKISTVIQDLKSRNKQVGFVPTMGALHKGHLSLIQQSKRENDITACSIFVNPTQFNNPSDLKKYPRVVEQDLQLLKSINCDLLYLPEVNDVYPNGPISEEFNFEGIENEMEGEHRPGHFNGVGTVVSRLFEITTPSNAYFGEKDFQQLAIIRKLNKIRSLGINIVGCDIIRESDGLAMSSRNVRLSKEHRIAAPLIYKALQEGKINTKKLTPNTVIQQVKATINASPFLDVEYVSIADEESLKPVNNWSDFKHVRLFTAVHAGDVRLIDNLHLF